MKPVKVLWFVTKTTIPILFVFFIALYLSACAPAAGEIGAVELSETPTTAEITRTPTQMPTATETTPPTSTETLTPTVTATSTQTKTPTMTPTPESARMSALIDQLYEEDVVHSLTGKYTFLGDFDQSWAQLYWYQWYRIGLTPENFVLRTDASWESASQTANWRDSGCGIVFSEKDVDNHHAIFLTMDGYVRTHKVKGGLWYDQQAGYYDRFDIPGDSAELILVVEDQVLTVLVNGDIIVQYKDIYIQRGHVGLSLASGTNKDFGTKCEMRNIDFWSIR